MKQYQRTEERENRILKNMGLIGFVASHIGNQLPSSMTREDLWQAGTIGLIRAVDTHSADKGSFSTYACLLIRASILDAEKEYNMFSEDELNQIPGLISFEQLKEEETESGLPADGFGSLERIEEKAALSSSMSCLKAVEKTIVEGHYYNDRTLKDVARENHLQYSKAVRIHKKAIGKMRLYLFSDDMSF